MRVLLDECLPLDFRHDLRGHDAHTAQWAGFKGKKNGELLEAAEAAGYAVLLTAITVCHIGAVWRQEDRGHRPALAHEST